MITRKSSTTNKNEKKRFAFQLGLSGFLSLSALVVIGMAWSFILGVIVGRGYQPEKVALDVAKQVLPEDFPLLTEKNEEVLKSEELEFFDKLKQGPSSLSTTPPAPAKAPEPAKPVAAAAAKNATIAVQAPDTQSQNKGEVFVFNYQIAALDSMDQAQVFLKKRDLGAFKTSVVTATHEGKTWYRVYVHHQGTVDSAMGLKEQLKSRGIDNILLRSRTPL